MQLLWENFQFVIILKEGLDSRTYAHTHTHTHTHTHPYESAWTMDNTSEIYRSLRKGSMEQSNYMGF